MHNKPMRLLLIVVTLTCTLPSPARAQDIATEADLLFRRGGQLFNGAKYEEALLAFLASNRLVRNKNALYNIAFCYLRLGQHSEAYRFFAEYMKEQLTADEQRVARGQLETLRGRVALVAVSSRPPGALVFVDRKDLGARGTTPGELALPPGTHTLTAALAGHHEEQRTVVLEVGKRAEVAFPLRRILGVVAVDASPAGAAVRVDRDHGPPAGRAPLRLELLPGRHAIYVTHEGHRAARSDVDVRAGKTVTVKAALAALPPRPGKLVVNANRAGALVAVDGQAVGATPVMLDLSAGKHRVVVSAEDYAPLTREITLAPGQRLVIDATLSIASESEVAAATKMVQSVEDAPGSITVISGEEIRALGHRTLGEVLRGVRGFYFSDDRQYQSIGVRGFGPPGDFNTRLLLLADGHALNDAWTGASFVGHDFAVDLSNVDRIEVVRGPGSALYGSGAFFGIVEVTSRTDEAQRVELGGAAGGFGEAAGRARIFQRLGDRGALRLSGGFLHSPRGASFADPAAQSAIVDNDGETAGTAVARLSFGKLTVLGRFNDRKKHLPTTAYEIEPGTGRAFVHDRRAFGELRWESQLSARSRLLLRGYYDHTRYDGRWPYSDDSAEDLTDRGAADWMGLEARFVNRPLDWLNVVAGAEGQYAPAVSQSATTDVGEPLSLESWLASGSGYALAEATVLRNLRLVAGVRLDYSSTGGFSPSPDAAAIWRPYPRGSTKLFFGRAFRAPSIYEIDYHDGGISQVPSSELGPETIYTWQLEHTHAFGGRLFATAGVYFNDVRGLINLGDAAENAVACTNPEGCVQYQNLGHVGTLGAEAEVRRSWGAGGSFAVAYAYQRSRDLELGPLFGSGSTPIINSPEHLVYLRAVRPLVRRLVVLGAEVIYGSPRLRRDGQRTAHMALANLTLSGSFAGARLRYALACYNLLDWRYGVPVGSEYTDAQQEVRQLGRSFLVSLSTGF